MEQVAVSIIVPVYNGEAYLEKCLHSLINQTLESYEIIVINDGSTDKTQEIIDRFSTQSSKIRAYIQDNKGVVATRSIALSLVNGEYVGWVDSDDFVKQEMFETLYDAAKAADADVVSCDYTFYPKEIKTKEKWFKEYKGVVDWFFIERNTQQWNKLVRRELLERIRMSHWMSYCGEGAYALALIHANKVVTICDQLYYYRVGHVSLSNNLTSPTWYEGNILRTEKQLEAIKENNLEEKWGEYYRYRVIYSLLQAMIVSAKNGRKMLYRQQRKKLVSYHMNQNPYTKQVLDYNHGKLKSFVMRRIVPLNYNITYLLTRIALK